MLDETQEKLCDENTTDFSGLKALILNCTLKPTPQGSHTDKLLGIVETILHRNKVSAERVRVADFHIAPGVYPDMTEHGWDRDDWPKLWEKVDAADILILATPIWLGEKSSITRWRDRGFLPQPDRRGEDQDVGSGYFFPKLWPVVAVPAMFGHVRIDTRSKVESSHPYTLGLTLFRWRIVSTMPSNLSVCEP